MVKQAIENDRQMWMELSFAGRVLYVLSMAVAILGLIGGVAMIQYKGGSGTGLILASLIVSSVLRSAIRLTKTY